MILQIYRINLIKSKYFINTTINKNKKRPKWDRF